MEILEIAKKCFDDEIEELNHLKASLNTDFEKVIDILYNISGKIIVIGVGKSGIIGKKIAATLMSTGTSAVFLNAAEALHGDLGVVEEKDIALIISNSGNSPEVLGILPSLKIIGCIKIALTGDMNSNLAKECDYSLFTGVRKEACPMNIAPTSSTTALLVMGDAIAISLMYLKKFDKNRFALFHPGGALGKKLLNKIENIMLPIEKLAILNKNSSIIEVVEKLSSYRIGAVCIVEDKKLVGIITDGDLKRYILENKNFLDLKVDGLMTKNFKYGTTKMDILEIIYIMENEKNPVNFLPILKNGEIIGGIRIRDILKI